LTEEENRDKNPATAVAGFISGHALEHAMSTSQLSPIILVSGRARLDKSDTPQSGHEPMIEFKVAPTVLHCSASIDAAVLNRFERNLCRQPAARNGGEM
jgi:hypothetical protein